MFRSRPDGGLVHVIFDSLTKDGLQCTLMTVGKSIAIEQDMAM